MFLFQVKFILAPAALKILKPEESDEMLKKIKTSVYLVKKSCYDNDNARELDNLHYKISFN